MCENYYEYEDELDIKALFIFVLRKWRILLSFMIVGCLFGCFFSVYKIYQSRPEAVLTRLNSLDKQEINEFEIKQYNDFKNLYDDYLKYEDKSLIMKFDPNSVYTATLSYSFTSSVQDAEIISDYFLNILNRGDNVQKIINETGINYSIENIKEIVFITDKDNLVTDNNQLIINNNMANDQFGHGKVIVNVFDSNSDNASKIKDSIEELLNSTDNELKQIFDNYQLVKTQDEINFGYSDYVNTVKQNEIKNRQSILDSLSTAETKLSDDEKLYYSYYYDYENAFENNETKFSLKWPVVFGIVFFVLSGIYYMAKYVMNDKIKGEDEIKAKYNLDLLGALNNTNYGTNKIDKCLSFVENNHYVDVEYLKNLFKSFDRKKILLCNEDPKLTELLSSIDKRIKVNGLLDEDPSAVSDIDKYDGVVLVSEVNKTNTRRFEREVEIARKLNKDIIGFISVR